MGTVSVNDTGHVFFTAATLVDGQLWRDSVRFTIGFAEFATVKIQPGTLNGRSVLTFLPPTPLILGEGGNVVWSSQPQNVDSSGNPVPTPGLDSTDVVFDDSTAVQAGQICLSFIFCVPSSGGGGNIPAFGFDETKYQAAQQGGNNLAYLYSYLQARSFPVAGTYTYHSLLWGTTGAIVVRRMTP
jgi:hypothetical protein